MQSNKSSPCVQVSHLNNVCAKRKFPKLLQRKLFSSLRLFQHVTKKEKEKKSAEKKQASSNSPVPLCTCWIPAQEDKACSGGIVAPRRSSTRPEKKSASSPPSGAGVEHRQAGVFGAAECGAQCRESHGCRIWGDFSLNRL